MHSPPFHVRRLEPGTNCVAPNLVFAGGRMVQSLLSRMVQSHALLACLCIFLVLDLGVLVLTLAYAQLPKDGDEHERPAELSTPRWSNNGTCQLPAPSEQQGKSRAHILMAADAVQFQGAAALLASIAAATLPGGPALVVTIAALARDAAEVACMAACAVDGLAPLNLGLRVVLFDVRVNLSALDLQSGRGGSISWYGNLSAATNFARFYMPTLLPQDAHFALWLDVDTIVLRKRGCDIPRFLLSDVFRSSPRAPLAAPARHGGVNGLLNRDTIFYQQLNQTCGQ